MFSRNSRDLIGVFVLTCVASAMAFWPGNNTALATIFALPLVFVLPGYALTSALFPKTKFSAAETLAASLGLSLAAIIVAGLALNFTPQGLTRPAWTILLGGVTLGAVIVAAMRRRGAPTDASRFRIRLNVGQACALGLSIVIVASALMIARAAATQSPTNFTQLWARPINPAERAVFEIGISNFEARPMEYRLEIKINDQSVFEAASIALAPGETWAKTFQVSATETAQAQALLYRADAPGEVYRNAVLRNPK